jgi:hypothetical protein
MSEAIILAAPSTEALDEVEPKLILGKTVAAKIPMITTTRISSIRVNPEGFKGSRDRGVEGLFTPRTPKAAAVRSWYNLNVGATHTWHDQMVRGNNNRCKSSVMADESFFMDDNARPNRFVIPGLAKLAPCLTRGNPAFL